MKKIYLLVISLFACFAARAYEPLTSWPYEYENFIPGRITTYQGGSIEYDSMNINLINNRPHFIKDGVIMEADVNTIALLVIGQDSYVCVGGKMMKVLRNATKGAVVLQRGIDAEAMSRANIGYGTSAMASTQNLSVSAISSDMEFSVNRSIEEVRQGKDSGDRLAVRNVTGLYYKGLFVPASRSDILAIPGIDRDKVKEFLKKEKIKFKNTDDLVRLLNFLYSL